MKQNPDFWGCGAEGNNSNTCVVKKNWNGGAHFWGFEAERRETQIFGGFGAEGNDSNVLCEKELEGGLILGCWG